MIYMVQVGGIALLKKFGKPKKNTKINLDYICQCHNLLIDVWCLFWKFLLIRYLVSAVVVEQLIGEKISLISWDLCIY